MLFRSYCHIVKIGGVAAIREQARIMVEQELRKRQELLQVEKIQQQHQVPEPGSQTVGKKIIFRFTIVINFLF